MDEKEYVDLQEHRAMLYLPENAVEITVHAKVYHDGELIEVSNVYGISEIREAFRKADDGYIDEDDKFFITDKGIQYLEEIKKKHVQ